MKFHLNHHPKKFDFELKHGDKIIFVGSCFSENMAAYFRDLRFSILNNPYGILFNPLSINTCFFFYS